MKKIFLIGMPGSGKSTIGKLISSKLGYDFYDLDSIIEKEQGQKITDIFEMEGEQKFRILEREALSKIADKPGAMVVSCGGGTPCFFDNLKLINSAGRSVYIDVPLKTLVERTLGSSKRPLLAGQHETKMAELLEQRIQYYSRATSSIKTKGVDSIEVAKRLLDELSSS